MFNIRFRIFSNNVEFKKTITGPHPLGVIFSFETGIKNISTVEVRAKEDSVRWIHAEQIFEVWHSSMYAEQVWTTAGFTKEL